MYAEIKRSRVKPFFNALTTTTILVYWLWTLGYIQTRYIDETVCANKRYVKNVFLHTLLGFYVAEVRICETIW